MTAYEIIAIFIGILDLLIAFGGLTIAFLRFLLDKKNEEEKKDEEEEGTVVEKDDSEINKNADKSGTEAGNRPQVERPES